MNKITPSLVPAWPLNQEVDRWVRAMRVSGVAEETIDRVLLTYFEWTTRLLDARQAA